MTTANDLKLPRGQVVVVGIDAAFANMGMVKVVVDAKARKVVKVLEFQLAKTTNEVSKTNKVSSDRVRRGRELLQAMRSFCYGASIAIAEIPEGSQDASAAWALGVAVGIVCACPLPLVEVTPRDVKKITGGSKADKEHMRQWAYARYPDAPWLTYGGKRTQANEHLADAMAAVEFGITTDKFRGYAGAWTAQELLSAPYEDRPRRRLKE